ncbi:MAG TPA: glycosyltransferase family 1 protein, partial [Casimicrobiaceae bacterium]|nr:glycosyltransferase family 1 protein [Casimicrobiaceae bacterium]
MRLVVDLEACQTASRLRGIGRYSLALADALARAPGPHQMSFVLNAAFPESVEWLRDRFADVVPAARIHAWTGPTPVAESEPLNGWRTRAAEAIREGFVRSLRPDAVLVSSLFEGFVDDATTSIAAPSRALGAAMLYDLIPLVRSSILDTATARRWYERKLEWLHRADLLLAISNHAKEEAISAAGLPSARIAVISTAADPCFRPLDLTDAQMRELSARYAITGPFLLYAGGYDERKNVRALIVAFASLTSALRDRYRLVLAGAVEEPERRELARLAERNRMSPERLVFTGRVDDADLVLLYNGCTLFVFPSLHEGFGLPVLEAMACGAAVIASNATSIPEVIDRTDALFDPADPDAIAERLHAALSNEDFLAALRRYAIERSAAFSWETTGQRALDALVEHWKRKCHPVHAYGPLPAPHQTATAVHPPPERPTLAFVSPLPPE